MISVVFAAIGATPVPQDPESPFWLEIPTLQVRLDPNGDARIPQPNILQFDIHVARRPGRVNFSSIHAKINAEAANTVMTVTSGEADIMCHFDLALRPGFRLRAGRNDVEIEFMDTSSRPYYTSFLLDAGPPPEYHPRTAAPVKLSGDKYAVIIGVSQYKNEVDGLTSLRFADQDARAFEEFLLSPAGGSFAKENIQFLVNESATNQSLRSALFTFLTRPGPNDFVVIYIAGHGAPDPNDPRNLYLLPYDADPNDMGGTAFPMHELPDIFSRVLKAHHVVTFTDTCHSYGFSGAMGGHAEKKNNLINEYLRSIAGQADRAVITASDVSELSFESEQWGKGHGVFTYYLLRGLGGAADLNHDGTVTAGELFAYVRDQVRKETGGQQNPVALPGLAETIALAGVRARPARATIETVPRMDPLAILRPGDWLALQPEQPAEP